MFSTKSNGEVNMVTNAKLAKDIAKKKERNKILEEALEEMKVKLEELEKVAKKKDGEEASSIKGKEKAVEEDAIPTLDPPLAK